MENCMVNDSIVSDLSQSYSQGIERVTGSKDHYNNFQLPKEILQAREQTWEDLFDKYLDMMPDGIELNVDTLESEKVEEEVSGKEYKPDRVPMRKSSTLVQYWVNTGNPPYKVFLDLDKLSESGSSISEKEIVLSPHSLLSNATTIGKKNKQKSDSSCSTVDTAAYILSNANVTKKADTIAILEGAKFMNTEPLKKKSMTSTENVCDDKIESTETIDIIAQHVTNNDKSDACASGSTLHSTTTEYVTLKTDIQRDIDTITPVDKLQHSKFSRNVRHCNKGDKIDTLNSNKKNLDVRNIEDIACIFQNFDKTSKRLTITNESADEQNEVSSTCSFNNEEVSQNQITEESDTNHLNLTAFHCKKLYTGRNSPIDLISIKRHSMYKLSGAKQSLHPALDPDCTTMKKKSLIHKSKKKNSLQLCKKICDSKKDKMHRKKGRRENLDIYNQNITSIEKKLNNDKSESISNSSSHETSSDFGNNSYKQDNNTKVKIQSHKEISSLVNLNPVVLLEKLPITCVPSTSYHIIKNPKNKEITQKHSMRKRNHICSFRKLYACEVENLELETVDSDGSTILICKCKNSTSQCSSSSDSSFCLRIDTDNLSDSNAGGNNNELLNSKNLNKNLNQLCIKSQLSSNKNDTNTVKLQVLHENDVMQQKKLLNKTKPGFSNSYKIHEVNNLNMPEVKVLLERLPASIYHKYSNKTAKVNTLLYEEKVLRSTNLHNSKRKPAFKSGVKTGILARKNITFGHTIRKMNLNYLSKMQTKLKKNKNKISDASYRSMKYNSEILDEAGLCSPRKKCYDIEVNQDKDDKYPVSILFSSDEDDFVQLIQSSHKKQKMSMYEKTNANNIEEKCSNENKTADTNKDNCHYKNDSNIILRSSKQLVPTKIDKLTKRKEISTKDEAKSLDNSRTVTASIKKSFNKKFSFFQSESDNDSTNSDKRKNHSLFPNDNTKKNKTNERDLNTIINKNEVNDKGNTHIIIFKTKTSDIDSSDSEKSNNDNVIGTNSPRSQTRTCSYIEKSFNTVTDNKKEVKSLQSSYDTNIRNQIHNSNTKSRSMNIKEPKTNNQLLNKSLNDSIQSVSSNLTKNACSNTLNSLFSNEKISKESKKSILSHKNNGLTVTKLLKFQTKCHYDSDSSECS